MATRFRLADDVVVEPLVSGYAAWWCVLAPLPASLHAAGYQLPALRSYVRNPALHVRAAADPALAGGPFVDVPPERAAEVERLLADFERAHADAVAFGRDYWDFVGRLHEGAQGQALAPFYDELPPSMRGLVELAYDYFNRPTVRFDEGLLYASNLYREADQSVRLWRLERDGQRPFYMSTPRLGGEGQLELRLPLGDPALDVLCRLDVEPQPREALYEALGEALGDQRGGAALEPYLVEDGGPSAGGGPAPPGPSAGGGAASPGPSGGGGAASPGPSGGGGVRVRYLGHASVLLEADGVSVLVDPVVSPRPSRGGEARVSFGELPAAIDYVLVTHAHPDHFHVETLVRLRHRVGTLVVPRNCGVAAGDVSLKRLAHCLGFRRVVELDTFEAIDVPGGRITGVPFLGEHGDVLHGNKVTYAVRLGRASVLFAADSACLDANVYRRVRARLGEVDTVFLNTEVEGAPLSWPFDALFPKKRDRKREQTRRCRGSNADEGIALVEALGAKRLYNYALGLEPWLGHILGPAPAADSTRLRESDRLLGLARARGIEAERLAGPTERRLPA